MALRDFVERFPIPFPLNLRSRDALENAVNCLWIEPLFKMKQTGLKRLDLPGRSTTRTPREEETRDREEQERHEDNHDHGRHSFPRDHAANSISVQPNPMTAAR
jgi:hypothetical protein